MRASPFLLLVACGGAPAQPTAPPEPPPAPAPLAPADAESVLEADRAFFATTQAHDHVAFADRVAPDAIFFGSRRLDGREAVATAWKRIIDGDVVITWGPDQAFVSQSGDLAYTIGTAQYGVPEFEEDEPDEATVLQSTYVTIWKRGEDGVWRAAVDIGTAPQKVEVEPEGEDDEDDDDDD